jgi:large subunit ribosomal protein L10
MKKIGLLIKEDQESKIKGSLKENQAVFVVRYSGLSSVSLSNLRQSLKDSRATLFVVKNSVARRALKERGLDVLIRSIEGPCGLIFIKEEPVGASKVLFKFFKENEQLKLAGGLLKDRIIEENDIEEMAKLPSREVLRAMLVATLSFPLFGFVRAIKYNLNKFVYCIEQKQKKE